MLTFRSLDSTTFRELAKKMIEQTHDATNAALLSCGGEECRRIMDAVGNNPALDTRENIDDEFRIQVRGHSPE